jgi:hypothetical protein
MSDIAYRVARNCPCSHEEFAAGECGHGAVWWPYRVDTVAEAVQKHVWCTLNTRDGHTEGNLTYRVHTPEGMRRVMIFPEDGSVCVICREGDPVIVTLCADGLFKAARGEDKCFALTEHSARELWHELYEPGGEG